MMLIRTRNWLTFIAILSLVTALAVPAFSGTASAQVARLTAAQIARIDSVFQQYDSKLTPGCACAVVHNGTIAFEKGYGMSDFQHDIPIVPNSIFHVASISKQFTTFSILLLEEDGKLSLDDDIRRYIPEVPDFGSLITIRHLIHHTSGLRDQWQLLSLAGWRADDPKSESDILWLVSRQRALNFTPGAEHLYSNTGYTLLGTIVARVSGKSLREFTNERIFEPLGMSDTHFHDDHTMIVPRRTSAYSAQGRAGGAGGSAAGASPLPFSNYRISIPVFDNAGATSLFTTVRDMAKWELNFLQPRVGTEALIDKMFTRGTLNNGSTIPYAYALTHGQYRGLPTVGHSGSDAGYRADYVRFPEQRMAFITLCNVSSANPGALNREVAGIVLEEHIAAVAASSASATGGRGGGAGPAAPAGRAAGAGEAGRAAGAAGAVTTPERLREFVGSYRSEELDVYWNLSLAGDTALVLSRRRLPDQRLQVTSDDAFTAGVGSVQFTRDGAGRVNGFLLTSGRVRNIRFDRAGG